MRPGRLRDESLCVTSPVLFDFRDPLPVPDGAAHLVAGLADAVPRVGLLLGSAAGRSVVSSCPGVRRAALEELTSPGAVWAPLACGLPDPGVLVVSAASTISLADLLMGGLGGEEDRRSTPLEQALLVRHVLPALRPLTDALADSGVTELASGPVTDEPVPAGAGEVLAIGVDLTLPSRVSARVTLCLPARTLLPAPSGAPVGPPVDPEGHVLGGVPVEVSLRLPGTVVSAADVDDLAPGDVIRLDEGAAAALVGVLQADGRTTAVLTAALGRRGRARAVRVDALLPGAPLPVLPPSSAALPSGER